ncbi:rare lipoprotein A [Nitratireductor indicus]|nr:rare lipoprotein A [Nitratireductor indicus]
MVPVKQAVGGCSVGHLNCLGEVRRMSLVTSLSGRNSMRRLYATIAGATCLALLSACTSTTPKVAVNKTKSKEYFAESEYGVKASPRISSLRSNLPRGGGRYQVGKPYQVKGKWYKPKEDPDYVKTGAASWYGDAFHGRLTANGEVYDMTHLTAAHPTMPLPSYARVTNLSNGSSVVVRVNDRGPFAHNRLIDLSKRAAELLDYQSSGVAQVKVEYVGPAPIEGRDDQYLMASYRPGNAAPDPSDGLSSGVMVAMNGATPTSSLPGVTAANAFASQPGLTPPAAVPAAAEFVLPSTGPIVPARPHAVPPSDVGGVEVAALSYADRRIAGAARAFDTVLDSDLNSADLTIWWKGATSGKKETAADGYLNAGTWQTRDEAANMADKLSQIGASEIQAVVDDEGNVFFALNVQPDGRMPLDRMLQTAWAAGATDAFAVR